MLPIRGLFETHLTVRDLDRPIAFCCDVVGLTFTHEPPAQGIRKLPTGRNREDHMTRRLPCAGPVPVPPVSCRLR